MLAHLFPDEPRSFYYRGVVRTILRTLHILTAGVLLGGYVFNQPNESLMPWVYGTLLSGLFLLITDLHATMAYLFEVRGVAVLIKLLLLAVIPFFNELGLSIVIVATIIGGVTSHLPRRHRHKLLLFSDRLSVDTRRG